MSLSKFSSYRDIELGVTELGQALSPHYYKRFGLRKHSTAQEINSIIDLQNWDNYFKFCFVRNPIDRAYSIYKFLKYNWKKWKDSHRMDSFDNFNEFVQSDFFTTSGPDRILMPQHIWCSNSDGEIMIDFVGKLENINSDISTVLSSINTRLDFKKIKIYNESRKIVSDPNIDSHSKEIIFRRYALDFKLFDYTKI